MFAPWYGHHMKVRKIIPADMDAFTGSRIPAIPAAKLIPIRPILLASLSHCQTPILLQRSGGYSHFKLQSAKRIHTFRQRIFNSTADAYR
jgi:hypothetical protein